MNLMEALQNTKCDVLRSKLEQFISSISNNTIPGFGCPVCSVDLRSSFEFMSNQEKHPGKGFCSICHLEIQMHHHIEHADHIVDPVTMQLCQYDITMPVSMATHIFSKLLRDKWEKMKLPRRQLTQEELINWMGEARKIKGVMGAGTVQ